MLSKKQHVKLASLCGEFVGQPLSKQLKEELMKLASQKEGQLFLSGKYGPNSSLLKKKTVLYFSTFSEKEEIEKTFNRRLRAILKGSPFTVKE